MGKIEKPANKEKWQPLDLIAVTLIIFLSLLIGLFIFGSKVCGTNCFLHIGPRVDYFSWQDKKIGAEDKAFIISFDRPMDKVSVEKNLVIKPPLSGKFSWAGRKLAYTLETPAPYGEKYQLKLQGAREKFRDTDGELIQPFVANFNTRDRLLGYIGSDGLEEGRLILYNWTKDQKTILTPPNLIVVDFKFYPRGDRILFSAASLDKANDSFRQLKLYKVTTGLSRETNPHNPSGKIELVLDNQDYQNNQFDLSADGETIVVQRVNRQNPTDFDLWVIKSDNQPQPLKIPGGDFLIAPDNQTLAVAQGQGIGLLPLKPDAKPLDFLPKYGRILSFSQDGSAATMVNFNTDNANLSYTQSLFYVNNQGIQKELLNVEGSIIDCEFHPNGTSLYCLLTEIQKTKEYQEQPYFVEINIKTASVIPLVALPQSQDIQISMAPDGLGIIFDQMITSHNDEAKKPLRNNVGETIIGSHLWLLIPTTSQSNQAEVEQLPLAGFRPRWLP